MIRKLISSLLIAVFVAMLPCSCFAQHGPTPPRVDLTWTNPSQPSGTVAQYNCIYRGTSAGSYGTPPQAVFCSSAPLTAWSDTSVARGVTYHYAVTVVVKVGTQTVVTESAYSNDASAPIPTVNAPTLDVPQSASLQKPLDPTAPKLVAKVVL